MVGFPKQQRIVLTGPAYRELVTRCYDRDGWKCRRCSNREQLTPHHIIKRSDCRIDTDYNIVTVCVRCHNLIEASLVMVIGNDANDMKGLMFRWSQST